MKTNKITQAIGALALVGIAMPAVATDQPGWYLGAGGGPARATIAKDEIIADLANSGFETSVFRFDDREFGYKIFAGYKFNQHFALEGGYFNLGEFNYTATTVPAGTKTGELDFRGWNLDLIGMYPLTERSSLFARIGAHNSKSTVDFVGTGAVNVFTPHYQKTSTHYKVGAGYQYQVNDSVALRFEVERYRMDDAVGNRGDIDLYSVNVLFRFGATSHAPAKQVPVVEEPATAAPAPAPVVVDQVRYCSELDIEFEIAKNDIQRVNREHMLVLATFLDKYPETRAVIEGHTDNVGNDADNLRLSQERAQSVVNYLTSEHDIDGDRLTAVGYGETRPVADNDTDAGKQANRRINAIIGCATDIEGLEPIPARITLAMELEFPTNGSTIDPKYHDQLGDVAEYLEAHPDLTVTLEGHTDNASPEMAQKISRERAQSVADYLVKHFTVDRSRLNVEGFGATRRNTYNVTASDRQDNRRVNIILGYPNK
ncbi:OmpA family protein [Pseudidiomarina salinarum]|nr:OmpA family protein [Pseudidiomarina salinarum]RUO69298.1 OmpA family protein [Pseudidiomarina salinarum]